MYYVFWKARREFYRILSKEIVIVWDDDTFFSWFKQTVHYIYNFVSQVKILNYLS